MSKRITKPKRGSNCCGAKVAVMSSGGETYIECTQCRKQCRMVRAEKPKRQPPKTAAEWAAYRARLSCSVGKDWLRGGLITAPGCTRTDHAMYELLTALENLVELMEEVSKEAKR